MNIHCPHCLSSNSTSDSRKLIVAFGKFQRKSDHTTQQRFRCNPCQKTFSQASLELCFRQKKRTLNPDIFKFLVSGVSMRRSALLLKTNRKTIARKLIFLGQCSEFAFKLDRLEHSNSQEVEFDDLETFEHTKLKPLSVTMAVETGTRRILGFRVARMPAKGLLVKRSLKKYGPRKDERKLQREDLFKELKNHISPLCTFKSDENPHYPSTVKRHFPLSHHKRFKGRRGCVVGQGELKAGGFDPLFSLNHSFAMTRANMHRLFRRSWNTTKKPESLKWQFYMYITFHNLFLIRNRPRQV